MPRTELQYTLVSDGPKDRVLIPILTWLLHQHLPNNCAVQRTWADFRRLPKPPRTLNEKIRQAVVLYPCDLLFIHRDAEGPSRTRRRGGSYPDRKGEMDRAVDDARRSVPIPPAIAVIPARMTESWLLLDVDAIRTAACNRNGSVAINLPRLADVESIPDPKGVLERAIREATEKGSHRLERFNVNVVIYQITQCIEDFSPLRGLSAFNALEERLLEVIREQQWHV